MESVLVKSIYSVDTISKGNSKAWVKLMEYMEGKDYDVYMEKIKDSPMSYNTEKS